MYMLCIKLQNLPGTSLDVSPNPLQHQQLVLKILNIYPKLCHIFHIKRFCATSRKFSWAPQMKE